MRCLNKLSPYEFCQAQIRIALCGYEGEHKMPDSWQCVQWKARGGYGSQGNGTGRENSGRERIWFSPHCLNTPLFNLLAQTASNGFETTA